MHKYFSSAEVFIEASLGNLRLNHPEGIAIDSDGSIWCGGDTGEIYRVEPDGSNFQLIASSNGFSLGMSFDLDGNLYVCDLSLARLMKFDKRTKTYRPFSSQNLEIKIPNYPVVDSKRNRIYVSDSHGFNDPGPGVWVVDLDSGEGFLWSSEVFDFANGMALSKDSNTLFIAETFSKKVSAIPINSDGSAGAKTDYVTDIAGLPDGLAIDEDENLFISCYEPSRIFCFEKNGNLEIFLDDPTAHLMCHPTNIAFRGPEMFTTNLGRWQITRILTKTQGIHLPI